MTRTEGGVLGYVVVLTERSGELNLSWDGELHPTSEAAQAECDDAGCSGWDVQVGVVRHHPTEVAEP